MPPLALEKCLVLIVCLKNRSPDAIFLALRVQGPRDMVLGPKYYNIRGTWPLTPLSAEHIGVILG